MNQQQNYRQDDAYEYGYGEGQGRPVRQRMQAPQDKGLSAMAVVGLVLGIVALVFCWIPIVNNVAFFFAIAGLVFSVIGFIGTGANKKRGRGIAVAGLVLAVISGACVMGTQAMYSSALDSATESMNKSLDRMSGDATDEILGTEVDVQIGDFTATQGSYGMVTTSLPVTITNLLDESKSYNVEIEAVDASGNRLDTSYVMANNLGAGQSQSFEAFTYVPSDKVDQMESATYKVVEVSQY